VLYGGLIRGRTYLVSGPPGTGKTTLGWHFLCDGAARGEAAMYISFGESTEQLLANAAASGLDTTGVHIVDLSPSAGLFAREESYDIFSPGEVEREPTTIRIVEAYERIAPRRIFVDSMTDELRNLTEFRVTDVGISYLADNVIFLRYVEQKSPGRSELRKAVGVLKKRLGDFEKGLRSFETTSHGIEVGQPIVLSSIFAQLPLVESDASGA